MLHWRDMKNSERIMKSVLEEQSIRPSPIVLISSIRVNGGRPIDNEGMWAWHLECKLVKSAPHAMIIRCGDDFSDYIVRWRKNSPPVNPDRIIWPISPSHFQTFLKHLEYKSGIWGYYPKRGMTELDAFEYYYNQVNRLPPKMRIVEGQNTVVEEFPVSLLEFSPEFAISSSIEWETEDNDFD